MTLRNTLRISRIFIFLFSLLTLMPSMASAQRGIAPEGREFFIGYMPPFQQRFETSYFALVGSGVANNQVTIYYFNEDGSEQQGPTVTVNALEVKQIPLNRMQMRPTWPGEKIEYKGAVIRSRYPVSVQIYNEGTLSGGMYLAIPTPGLGKHYVISAWNDNPTIEGGLQSGWNGHNLKDSNSSHFMIVGAYDGTSIEIITNSTTFANQIGVNSGYGANGIPHPKRITLNKGETYWVRSRPGDREFDLSGSVLRGDKPFAVLSGHEKALIGDPSGIWHWLDNDFRDMMLEQMIPVESWATGGYVSIPFEPPMRKDSRMLKNGEGDLYRMYTHKQSGGAVFYQGGRVSPYTYQLGEYQLPVAQRENVIEDAVNVYERDADKMYVVMYDYFQGIHDRDPGEGSKEKGNKPTESTNYTTPNEMNVIPMRNWRKTALFKVPSHALYRGAQFINIITHRDSLTQGKIQVKIGGKDPKSLNALPGRRTFSIPGYPELIGKRIMLAAGDYYIYGNTPIAVYSYGRTEGWYKDDFGYAAPAAGAYGNFEEDTPPMVTINPNCSSWDVIIEDDRAGDQGLADIFMLNDPNAQLWQPGYVTRNMRMTPNPIQLDHDDDSVGIQIVVEDPFKDAEGYLYVVDRAGNDTVYKFTYKAPSFARSVDSIYFGALDVGSEKCSTITFTNTAAPGGIPVVINKLDLLYKNQDIRITNVSRTLPATLGGGESMTVTVCYTADDALVLHLDSLLLETDCFIGSIALTGEGKAPAIYAHDWDFGTVSVGGKSCKDIKIENVGTAAWTLTRDWVQDNLVDFTLSQADQDKLSIVIQPGTSITVNFCYEPKEISDGDSARIDWGTDMPAQFKGQKKDYTKLWGKAVAPQVVWTEDIKFFDVECDAADTQRVELTNILTSQERILDLIIFGPDADEFSFAGSEHGWTLPDDGYPVDPTEIVWFDVVFKANLSKGYGSRLAYIRTVPLLGKADTIVLNGNVIYADLKASVPNVDFGLEVGGVKVQRTVRFTNPGTADLVVRTVDVSNPVFTIVSGIKVGDVIKVNEYTDVVLEATAPNAGTVTGDLLINGMTACPPTVEVPLSIGGYFPTAQGTGLVAPMTFVCRDRTDAVEFQNGPVPVRLDMVEIVDGTGNFSQHWHFADGSRVLNLMKDIAGDGKEIIPVIFEPTSVIGQGSTAIVRYTWTHVGSETTRTIEQPLVGSSQVLTNTLSVAKEDNTVYSADPMERFSVDVKMLQDIIEAGDIKKVKFGIEFQQDLFRFETFDPGINLSANDLGSTVVNNVETRWFEVNGNVTAQDVLGTLQFTLLVSRDLESPFRIITPEMYASDNQVACYMTVDQIPASFIPREFCGTQVIRDFLNDRMPTSVITMTPNPAKDVITLTYDVNTKNVPVTIEVYDVLGNKVTTVMEGKSHNTGRFTQSIDASKLATGNYTVRIVGGDHVSTRMVQIKH